MSDDWRSGYREPNAPPLNQRGSGRANGYGSSGRSGGNGSGGNGNGRGGYGYGPDGGSRADRSVPGGRRVATGRHGFSRGGGDGGAAGDDTGAWYRPRRSDSARTAAGRSARPGYYGAAGDRTGVGGRTARYGVPGRYGPGGAGRGPGGPGGGRRDMRALIDPDGQTPLPLRMLRRLWYGRWWRHWSLKKVGALFGALCATMALALVATFFIVLHSTKVPLTALSKPLNQSSLVYFSNGKIVGCFCTAGRFPLTENEIKKSHTLVNAVLAAEDRAFFTEGGISVTGLMRAAKNDLSGGTFSQGGSTITEQFVKTYYDSGLLGSLSFATKFKEIFVSIKLAQMEPKLWILTHYLNAIPFGSGANGVEAAAQTYFRVHAWKLSVAQAAMIAAMIQAPGLYDPQNPRAPIASLPNTLLERWVYVLTNMLRDGKLSQAKFNRLVPDALNTNSKADLKMFPKIKPSQLEGWSGYRGYIMQLVANELDANYHMNFTTTQIGNLGLQIHTSISQKLMNALYKTIQAEKRQMAALGTRMPSYVHISAVLEKPGTGKIVAFYGGPGYGVKHCLRLHCNVNTILTGEPVGSSFKPYVLATAVSQGMDVRRSVLNSHSPLCIPPDFPPYQFQISKQTTHCNTPVGYWQFNEPTENEKVNLNPWEATAISNDPAFEDLIHRTGVQNVINMAQTLGVSKYTVDGLNALFGNNCPKIKNDPNCHPGAVNAALGEGDLTAVDQANTFSVLVSGGKLVTPHIINSVSKNGARLVGTLVRTQAVPPAVAADTDYGLSFDTSVTPYGAGTGVPNAVWPGRTMIAKTGTLGSGAVASQAWFIGAIRQYALSIGMFTDKPNAHPAQILDVLPPVGPWSGGYGGAWPATIWHAFMTKEFSQLPNEPLPTPSYTGNDPTFKKWVLALPPKKKHCRQQGGGGQGGGGQGGGGGGQGGPGGGHGHHHLMIALNNGPGNGHCQGDPRPKVSTSSPPTFSPSPHPTSPSPSPTVTLSPSPTPTPSGSPSTSPAAPFAAHRRQRAPSKTVSTASLSAVAILPNQLIRKAAWVVTSGLG